MKKKHEWKELESKGKLPRGIKKEVLTKKDVWYMHNIFYDHLSHDWYIRAENKLDGRMIDFHVTTGYFNKQVK